MYLWTPTREAAYRWGCHLAYLFGKWEAQRQYRQAFQRKRVVGGFWETCALISGSVSSVLFADVLEGPAAPNFSTCNLLSRSALSTCAQLPCPVPSFRNAIIFDKSSLVQYQRIIMQGIRAKRRQNRLTDLCAVTQESHSQVDVEVPVDAS